MNLNIEKIVKDYINSLPEDTHLHNYYINEGNLIIEYSLWHENYILEVEFKDKT